ncbi:putative ATP-dependent DNA helicase [Gordonia effusa NBRC 100432]|uniref:DNA 3'-5' helicase n=1 Tax=Gordonia effusa NBRC 100432 TaxID=1077974 RepID=H0R0Y3_9ACTN|nr:DEAD/DEAH box helicase [Gordonia effusa]GAB18734.1 putative ATP-dependent DNA helicase [Gordonia effusa NBRC 100432]
MTPTAPVTLQPAQQQVADQVIGALAGPGATFRADQLRAVGALLSPAARVLVVQATGWGKSAVYWAATAIRRSDGAGPTLIVSPLLSLMRDQVAAAQRAGLVAATLNSSNIDEWSAIEEQLRNGDLDVLLVSPERLANPGFGRRVLQALAGNLGLLVIDEAHAISDWGHDFRPDYRRVSDVLTTLNPDTPVLATTATANARVTDDVAAQLGHDTLVLRGPLARKSLHLNIINGLSPIQRYGWITQSLPSLPGSGIVYALTVADTDRLVAAIKAVHGSDYPVAAYSGQLEPAARHRLEDALLHNEIKALVATSALGMGYDKPDLGFVVHVGSPPSPVSYYQQVGRAGRAIDESVVALLASPMDDAIWEYFATATIPNPNHMETLLNTLGGQDDPMSVPQLESVTNLRRGRIELMLKQLAVDDVVERDTDGWRATGKEWVYDQAHYDGVVAARRREADIMRDYVQGRACLMRLLVESLDDPDPADCGNCSVCRGQLTDGLVAAPDPGQLRTITTALRRDAMILEPRKMWPGGAFGQRGRIGADAKAEVGRVLIHADAPEWSEVLRAAQNGDADAITELGEAAVSTLAAWVRAADIRPDSIVSLRLTGSDLAESVANHLRTVGRRPGSVLPVRTGRTPDSDATGAVEATYWRDHIEAPEPGAVAGQVVLVVADASSSGWPLTIAAAKLREAGASAVMPLLIHRTV